MRILWLALLASLMPASAQAQNRNDPILVPEVSQHNIVLQQGFTGTELLLYGAVLNPRGRRAGAESAYDIVIVLKGPTEPIDRLFGITDEREPATTDHHVLPARRVRRVLGQEQHDLGL